jgi:hypothetical protein
LPGFGFDAAKNVGKYAFLRRGKCAKNVAGLKKSQTGLGIGAKKQIYQGNK